MAARGMGRMCLYLSHSGASDRMPDLLSQTARPAAPLHAGYQSVYRAPRVPDENIKKDHADARCDS